MHYTARPSLSILDRLRTSNRRTGLFGDPVHCATAMLVVVRQLDAQIDGIGREIGVADVRFNLRVRLVNCAVLWVRWKWRTWVRLSFWMEGGFLLSCSRFDLISLPESYIWAGQYFKLLLRSYRHDDHFCYKCHSL